VLPIGAPANEYQVHTDCMPQHSSNPSLGDAAKSCAECAGPDVFCHKRDERPYDCSRVPLAVVAAVVHEPAVITIYELD